MHSLLRHPSEIDLQGYRHKSEAEIARMTPRDRVDEFAQEQAKHKYDFLDDQWVVIEKHIWRDGLTALPRIIEIINDYDQHAKKHKAERFDAMWMLLEDLDNHVIRLRGAEEGRLAMRALENAIQRMRAAGYSEGDNERNDSWRFELALISLKEAKTINGLDRAIRETFRLEYKIVLSDTELLEFSNYLVLRNAEYPSWSKTNYIRDFTRTSDAGYPLRIYVMQPKSFYEAYLKFKKAKG
jgi:hypothetical protein